jgi:hypothetical protein
MKKEICVECYATGLKWKDGILKSEIYKSRKKAQEERWEKGIIWCPSIIFDEYENCFNDLEKKNEYIAIWLKDILKREIMGDNRSIKYAPPPFCKYKKAHKLFDFSIFMEKTKNDEIIS